MTKTAPTYSFNRIVEVLSSISDREDRVYAYLLFWLACREGEIIPYAHFKHKYSKKEGEIKGKLLDKKHLTNTFGINIDDVHIENDDVLGLYIDIDKVPVFKTKDLDRSKNGLIFAKGNPFFNEILGYVRERKQLREQQKESGDMQAVYLFPVPAGGWAEIQRSFWTRRKRLDRHLKLADKEFRIHSLRRSRASIAGNNSGDVFYVRNLTGHKSIEMASTYVAKRKLLDSMKKYEVEKGEFSYFVE